ncbi:MAG: prepilin-type N-terminal cleavage/methylation domain-containing protein [Chthoniobacteraceae bacterium]
MKHRRTGFTLLEVMLAVAVILMMLLIAVPSMQGIFAEDEIRKSYDEFTKFALEAQDAAISGKHSVMLMWEKDGIVQVPDASMTPEEEEALPFLRYPENGTITLERPAALLKKAPVEWTFWRSGACEPVRIIYEAEDGHWIAEFEPLTGRGKLIAMEAK